MKNKIAYYQENVEEREQIAHRGREAAVRFLLEDRVKDIFYILEQL